jgi:streptogramin lyase
MCAAPGLAASPAPTITEYAATPPGSYEPTQPEQMTVGGDGSIWYTDGGSFVYRMTASGPDIGQTTGFEALQGGAPDGIALGGDGNLWFTEGQAGELGRLNYQGGCCSISEFDLPSQNSTPGPDPDGITSGPGDTLWFTEAGNNQIGRVDLAQVSAGTSEGITEFPVPGATIGQTGGGNAAVAADSIAVGPDDDLWFTEAGSQKIGVMNISGEMVDTFPTSGTLAGPPYAIVEGPSGTMWFTESGSADRIGEIIPAGTTIDVGGTRITYASTTLFEFQLPPTPTGNFGALWSIVLGPDGNLWFTYGAGMGCINPEGYAAQYPAPTPGANPDGITVGADGAIWFAESNASKIARLSPVVCDATTNAQIQALAGSAIVDAAHATIPTLRRARGYRFRAQEGTTGRLVISLFSFGASNAPASDAHARAAPLLVARGSVSFPTAGSAELTITPTTRGRGLLTGRRSFKLTAEATFTPTAPHPAIHATKTFTLR